MKGTKGMQRKLFLFFIFLFSISYAILSLDLIGTRASQQEALKFSNVATLDNAIFEKSNEAFLPEGSEIINYEVSVVEDEVEFDVNDKEQEDSFIDNNLAIVDNIKSSISYDDNFELPDFQAEEKNISNNVNTLRAVDMVAKPSLNKEVSNIKDEFPDLKVQEGEEVLVSVSSVNNLIEKENVLSEKENVKNISFVQKDDVDNKEKQKLETQVSSINDESPFGVIVSSSKDNTNTSDVKVKKTNPFIKAFSAIKPEKVDDYNKFMKKQKTKEKTISFVSSEMLKKDLHKTYLSDNQYLSPVESTDEEEYSDNEEYFEEDVDSELDEEWEEEAEEYADDENFPEQENVQDALEGKGKVDINEIKNKLQSNKKASGVPSGPLKAGTREVLQMKIDFQDGSSAISGESVNLIRSFAQITTEQPTNSIEITIPQSVMNNPKKKKLIARRLSIVSNVLRNAGISDKQIKPVLSDRDENSFAFRVVSNDPYNRLRISKGTDIFGEEENVKEYNLMQW